MSEITEHPGTSQLPASEVPLILRQAGDLLRFALRLRQAGGKRGGYLCIACPRSGVLLATVLLGTVSKEDAASFRRRAEEQATRLQGIPGDVSSWQSRDPSYLKRGGAVRGRRLIYSFHGFSEPLDEAIALCLARLRGDMNSKVSSDIVAASGNSCWVEISRCMG